MLTQRVPQLHCDYLQNHTSDSKASPLALLAATCSSIGKSDSEKTKVPTLKSISPLSCKMSPIKEENFKSPFKPYKHDIDPAPADQRSSPSVISHTKSISTCSRLKPSPMFSLRGAPLISQSDSEKAKACYMDINRDSIPSYLPMKCHSTPLPSMPGKMHHLTAMTTSCHDHNCTRCAPAPRDGQEHLLTENRTTSSCSCATCNQSRPSLTDSVKCHYQMPPSGSINHSFKPSVGATPCRNLNCTNCTKIPHNTLQNFLHPALVHQCTHGSPSYVPIPPAPQTFDGYSKNSITSKPFICNWVAEGKHCGRGFASSEELFQHLRSHTSLQQQNQNNCETHPPSVQAPLLNPCTIHGCLCHSSSTTRSTSANRGALTSFSYGPSMRFSPYSRGVQSLPKTPSSYQGQSYLPHGMFHY